MGVGRSGILRSQLAHQKVEIEEKQRLDLTYYCYISIFYRFIFCLGMYAADMEWNADYKGMVQDNGAILYYMWK